MISDIYIFPDMTATSRSGRLRKKCSKFNDFESPEETDTKLTSKKLQPDKNYRSPSKAKVSKVRVIY